jgi:hypothetical protein
MTRKVIELGEIMNQVLKEINELYLSIQDYIDPPPSYLSQLADKQARLDFFQKADENLPLYNSAVEKLNLELVNLSAIDIIEAYQHGCRLLQRNLSGYMYNHFDPAYIPLMLASIQNDDFHTAHIFLRTLDIYAENEFVPAVLKSLNSKWDSTRQAALKVVDHRKLIEAIPKIREMMQDSHPEIADLAANVLKSWETNQQ